jgi:nitrogen fixation protein
MGQKYAAYNTSGAITGFYDSEDSPAPTGITMLAITDAQWQACIATPGYTVADDALTPPLPPTAAQIQAALATQWRAVRNQLLALADNAVATLDDAGTSSASVRAWRTALRGLPDQTGFPATVNWPVFPAGVTLPPTQSAAIAALLP